MVLLVPGKVRLGRGWDLMAKERNGLQQLLLHDHCGGSAGENHDLVPVLKKLFLDYNGLPGLQIRLGDAFFTDHHHNSVLCSGDGSRLEKDDGARRYSHWDKSHSDCGLYMFSLGG